MSKYCSYSFGRKRMKSYAAGQYLWKRSSSYSMMSSFLLLLIALVCTLQLWIFQSPSLSPTKVSTSSSTFSSSSNFLPLHPRWAYVFLLANCDPLHSTYRGMLYNILAATFVLQRHQTRSDVVVLIQMASSTSAQQLPEESLLRQLDIQIRYLPPPDHPMTFYELVMAKFHVLSMIEYSKILFLDGDVLPLCNLDFLMELSTSGRLGDTILHAMYEDPVNAGLFLVTPQASNDNSNSSDNNLVQRWNKSLVDRPPVNFRLWDGKNQSGWDFYCGNSDQGYLLYRVLFLESHSVSLIVGPTVEQYATEIHKTKQRHPLSRQRQPTTIESTDFLADYSCPKGAWVMGSNAHPLAVELPFYRDFYHMVGYSKAWESLPNNITHPNNPRDYWYWIFQQVVDRLDPNHTIIPYPIENLSVVLGKPKLRGDLLFTRPAPV